MTYRVELSMMYGDWNPKVRQSSQYHKDFPKYFSNCMCMYLKKVLFN